MLKVYITYNDEKEIKSIDKSNSMYVLHDMGTTKGKKEGFRLKGHYSAKKDPFVLVLKGEKPMKAFYREATETPVEDMLDYLLDNFDINGSID